ncbi:hypothetical protein Bbelb_331250 [Branchiostoma belcheri]|nr:hypothetical protein Bbelb_331250 [Branchiostoma belcheri]
MTAAFRGGRVGRTVKGREAAAVSLFKAMLNPEHPLHDLVPAQRQSVTGRAPRNGHNITVTLDWFRSWGWVVFSTTSIFSPNGYETSEASEKAVCDVSNRQRMGRTEVELLKILIDGINSLNQYAISG